MFSEIVNNLRLSTFRDSKFILVTKDVKNDANFVFCELLSHYINNQYTVVLVNYAQSCAHYNHMLLKSGINMRRLRENQQIITIDGLSEIEKLTMMDTSQSSIFGDLFKDSSVHCVRNLYYHISATIQKICNESRQFILFIDDISLLLNLGVNVTHIFSFIQYCRSLCLKNKDLQNILLLGSIHEKEDLLNKKLSDYLFHVADVKIQVEGLKTGYSKDVHGKITLNVRNSADGTIDCQKLLYKVTEEGAKLFTVTI